MDIERQVEIMEGQLANFDTLLQKMQYLTEFFGPDPEFTQEAADIVRSNICRKMDTNPAHDDDSHRYSGGF